jgi:hypothetical protein
MYMLSSTPAEYAFKSQHYRLEQHVPCVHTASSKKLCKRKKQYAYLQARCLAMLRVHAVTSSMTKRRRRLAPVVSACATCKKQAAHAHKLSTRMLHLLTATCNMTTLSMQHMLAHAVIAHALHTLQCSAYSQHQLTVCHLKCECC